MAKIFTAIGTRPEAIKMIPLLLAFKKCEFFESKLLLTGQHTELIHPFLNHFGITSDFQCSDKQGFIHDSAAAILKEAGEILESVKPDLVCVQGDTTSAFAVALAAFYARIPIAHLEAGLRTGNFFSPWPEEAHRALIDRIATYFFAPTEEACAQLISEGIAENKIWVVGNTSIDALRLLQICSQQKESHLQILVTIHRRENQGEVLEKICRGLAGVSVEFPHISLLVLVHPNPAVSRPLRQMLSPYSNIKLHEPVDHPTFIALLQNSLFVITDSGGIQEEAPFLGKPVLILRNTTERPEGVRAGTARLIGTDSDEIIKNCRELLQCPSRLKEMSKIHFPYGDGYAAERIVVILEELFFAAVS